jgi:hypothetical protein
MKKALIVGINNYPTNPLAGCVNDAIAFSSILERNGDGSPNFSIVLKTDVPTKSELMGKIKELFSGDEDTALFYFSGHGSLNELGGYIVTPDHQTNDIGISMDDILILANNSATKNKIIILDCCNSGAFGSPAVSGGTTAQIKEGITILTASRSNESAVEVNGHGVFTNLLLSALHGGGADLRGHITPGSVYAYIDQALGAWDQRPIFKTNITRFTSLREIQPPVPLEVLRKITTYFPVPEFQFPLDPTFEDQNKEIAKPENVAIFKHLQKFQSVGLVVPVDAEFMYFAAQNSKSCKLTALGSHYWRLVKDARI